VAAGHAPVGVHDLVPRGAGLDLQHGVGVRHVDGIELVRPADVLGGLLGLGRGGGGAGRRVEAEARPPVVAEVLGQDVARRRVRRVGRRAPRGGRGPRALDVALGPPRVLVVVEVHGLLVGPVGLGFGAVPPPAREARGHAWILARTNAPTAPGSLR
jgi:hypothetical protein